MLSNVMLVTNELASMPAGGREMLCKLNHNALALILGERLQLFELFPTRKARILRLFDAFRGHIDGLSNKSIDAAICRIQRHNVGKVFVDGSNLGAFVAVLKHRLPHIEVVCFFHNVEARFFWGAFANAKTLHSAAVLIINMIAERKAVLFSDKRLCLSERDSRMLHLLYGKGATHITPIALEDRLPEGPVDTPTLQPNPFALFVGGNFYANRMGIAWFVKHVTPLVNIKVCIVGNGMEQMRSQLEIPGCIEVIGAVESLDEWYRRASFVIAPIFDGSGMKTKVAEALMHGKKVVGTPEAFSGYEQFASRAGWCCSTPKEFVSAIKSACATITTTFNPELRAIYEDHFSLSAAARRLAEVLDEN